MAQAHTAGTIPAPGKYSASSRTKTLYSASIALGLIGFLIALYTDQSRAWHSYLTSYMFFTNLALGGLFFTAIQHVSKAGWSVTVRRLMEAMTAYLPFAAIGAIILLLGSKQLYIWMNADTVAHDAILRHKAPYLNTTFFVIRLVVFFAGWFVFSRAIIGNSIKQDADGNEQHTLRNVGWSIAFLLFFAISYSLFSVDTLMSLQPHWFSTIWGVYNFAGLFQSTLAVLVIITIVMMKKGLLRGLVSHDHLHDLGKFLKAFTIFYAYIGFSQFLLIWYANLPEETIFYLSRSTGGWMAATFSLFFLKFLAPFLLLLPKAAKRAPTHLVFVSILILVMQFVDIHWMVYPNLVNADLDKYGGRWFIGWQEIAPFLMFGGIFLYAITNFLTKNNIVPIRDPRIDEAIHHHVTY